MECSAEQRQEAAAAYYVFVSLTAEQTALANFPSTDGEISFPRLTEISGYVLWYFGSLAETIRHRYEHKKIESAMIVGVCSPRTIVSAHTLDTTEIHQHQIRIRGPGSPGHRNQNCETWTQNTSTIQVPTAFLQRLASFKATKTSLNTFLTNTVLNYQVPRFLIWRNAVRRPVLLMVHCSQILKMSSHCYIWPLTLMKCWHLNECLLNMHGYW